MLSGDVEEDDPYDFEPPTTSSSYACHSPLSSSPASSVSVTNFEAKKTFVMSTCGCEYCHMVVNIISRFVLRVHAEKAQNSIKLEHEALEYVYTAPRSSATRGQHCNGEFFRILYSTAEISYI